jgi:hypothetical protein
VKTHPAWTPTVPTIVALIGFSDAHAVWHPGQREERHFVSARPGFASEHVAGVRPFVALTPERGGGCDAGIDGTS